jgi:hypothetical protein
VRTDEQATELLRADRRTGSRVVSCGQTNRQPSCFVRTDELAAELFRADRRTGRLQKLIDAFCNFTKASKNSIVGMKTCS